MKTTGRLEAMVRRDTVALLTLTLLTALLSAMPRSARAQEEPDKESGRLVVTVADEAGVARGGACLLIVDAAGSEQTVCDEDGDGALAADGLAAGAAAVKPVQAAAGCTGGFGGEVEVPAGGEVTLTLTDACEPLAPTEEAKPTEGAKPTEEAKPTGEPKETEPPVDTPTEVPSDTPNGTPPATTPTPTPAPGPPTTGELLIALSSTAFGAPSLGACFEILDRATYATLAAACDADDGATDGQTTVANLPQGPVVVQQVGGDPNDNPTAGGVARIRAGRTTSVTLTTLPLTDLTVVPLNEDGLPFTVVNNTCFELRRYFAGGPVRSACVGTLQFVVFHNVPWGAWNLVETAVPFPGAFNRAEERGVYLDPDIDQTVYVPHEVFAGSLTLETVGADNGLPVYGACFEIQGLAAGPVEHCDSDLDGRIVVDGLPAGTYTVVNSHEAESLNGLVYASVGWSGVVSWWAEITAAAPDVTLAVQFQRIVTELVIDLYGPGWQRVSGACLTVYEVTAIGARVMAARTCDPPDQWGYYHLRLPRPGHFVLVTTPPPGYLTPAEVEFPTVPVQYWRPITHRLSTILLTPASGTP